jgi:hypothetical protein
VGGSITTVGDVEVGGDVSGYITTVGNVKFNKRGKNG